MRPADLARFAWRSLTAHAGRTLLVVVAMSIGVGAVVVLTSLGEGARRYVRDQFKALGSNLLVVLPGKAETVSGMGGMMSGRTTRDLTLDDALALRRIRGVQMVSAVNIAAGEISHGGRWRDAPVAGVTASIQKIWKLEMAQGRFLPDVDPRRASWVCVLGSTTARELFGATQPVGEWIRIGDRRFRVIGVLASKGQFVGIDMDEVVIIPVASAQVLFNLHSLLRVAVEAGAHEDVRRVRDDIIRTMRERHGEEDVTVLTEDAVSATFDRVLLALTMAVGSIASISLAVAGILIMNVMLITVTQRTGEVGLLKAIGAPPRLIRRLFLLEAAALSAIGGVAGLVIGLAGSVVIRQAYPDLPAYAPLWAIAAAFGTALVTGVLFGLLPARRAARLDAAAALARR
jgi:putative ABC transport system permease protein